ncbi:hypothetical protein [Streptacidiphilus sp. EB129]|uniref:hypothetical protein n=1 Tax=Streptacidiphilus sp. EB129 TaxID=3156262 RepID=UPI0035182CF7
MLWPTLLLMHYARAVDKDGGDAVAEADRRTSIADARAAVCIHKGTALDDIDPASDYDHSDRAYRLARGSWADLVGHGPVSDYVRSDIAKAYALWLAARPDLARDDRWPGLDEDAEG